MPRRPCSAEAVAPARGIAAVTREPDRQGMPRACHTLRRRSACRPRQIGPLMRLDDQALLDLNEVGFRDSWRRRGGGESPARL